MNNQSHSNAPEDELERLRKENKKLEVINKALMGQVERSMDHQGNAYSLFQTAIGLENRVGERTRELEQVLAELAQTNRDLNAAKEETETARARLSLSIETISEGFALFDKDDKLALCNTKFRESFPGHENIIEIGISFEDFIRTVVEKGFIKDAESDPLTWISERLIAHRRPGTPFVFQLSDKRWLQVSERSTQDGGVVSVYTDITEIKRSESQRRKKELSEKSLLLQATLDHIDHGVSVFDSAHTLTAWNKRFEDILELGNASIQAKTPLNHFLKNAQEMGKPEQANMFSTLIDIARENLSSSIRFEQKLDNARIIEVRRNPMPDGGFVATYEDITQSKNIEEALRESERRIRLVTDAMPALIAYVDRSECYQFTNKAYETWFDRPRSEINGRPMREVLGADLYDKRSTYVKHALDGMEVTFEMSIPTDRLSIEYALATYFPHFNADGEVIGFFALIQDITERRRNAIALEEAKTNLERRVEERTVELLTVNRELEKAKADAEDANLSKTRFLAAASHDLLQPLNAARVFVEALSERQMQPEKANLVANVSNALESVDELLSALLEISKLDAGGIPVEKMHIPVGPILWSLANELAPIAKAKGLRISAAPTDAIVFTDPKMLSRVLRNFLTNAIRYTTEGRILIGTRSNKDTVRIGVWDTGVGIPEDEITTIFEEFRRLKNAETLATGVGLGLAIVDRISRTLNAPVVVQSTLNKGSMFAIDLPPGDLNQIKLKRHEPKTRSDNKMTGMRILIIDNETTILEAMEALLSNWSCETISAIDEQDALDAIERLGDAPDLVLVDYHLDNGKTGLEALQTVRAIHGQNIPAIVITADRTDTVRKEAEEHQAWVLNKPLKPGRLRSLMTHVINKS